MGKLYVYRSILIELPKFIRQSEPASKNPSSEQISMQTFEKLRERSLSATKSSRRNIRNSVMYESLVEPIDVMAPNGDENKEVLINPDCFLGSIIDYICEVAVIPKTKPFEICTMDGEITEFSHVLSTSGLEYFEPKQTYLILLQEFDDVEGVEKKTPLLSKTSELYSSMLSKFRRVPSIMELEAKLTSKPVSKSKERLKSRRASRKDTKSGTLPPIKQNN
ncbi:hypothetical protein WA026_009140 [Henosepilachna vigintioctopunctata]|uniref:Uncharacterized protein n=1 Tax=Henosepilachna vigintioctopunctata TaxID=420089 RepID=A0AAW1UVP8_9CUCU